MSSHNSIDLVRLPDARSIIDVQPLDYANPYDFTKLHRHDYFEIILVQSGTGTQQIDTEQYNIGEGNVFLIYPGQVHLMQRGTSDGWVLQFRKNAFDYIHQVKHHSFFNKSPEIQCDTNLFTHLSYLVQHIRNELEHKGELSQIANFKAYGYLQVILLNLLELQHGRLNADRDSLLCSEFISLITAHITELKKVSEYADKMSCSSDKLNDITKKVFGKTALEVIHEELLLEIRRMMLLNELSLKEIAYALNFDTPGNFNAFVKSKSGMTPGELQQHIQGIHN